MLCNDAGLRAVQSFLKPARGTQPFEWLVLYSLGDGLNGPGGILHGGMAMALLDSAMAVTAVIVADGRAVVTTSFDAMFVRKVRPPCVVLCRAWVDKEDPQSGKEALIRACLENGSGEVYVNAEAQFAIKTQSPLPKL